MKSESWPVSRLSWLLALLTLVLASPVRAQATATAFGELVQRLSESGTLQAQNRIVPVVGDVSGAHALRAIARDIRERGETLSAFYISNVEYYLFQGGTFALYAQSLREFPHDERTTVIRSVFPSDGSRRFLPPTPNSYSSSITQSFAAMLADLEVGKYRTYAELVVARAH